MILWKMNLLETLEKYYSDKLLVKQIHPELPLTIWNYSRTCQFESNWDGITIRCRGLVTDGVTGGVVANPFPKFFNMEESKHTPSESFDVYEKMDGSLIIVFYYEGRWIVASRGSFTSEQAVAAQVIFDGYDKTNVDTDYTYMFEFIAPWNRIVVDYGKDEKLVLLGARYTKTGMDVNYQELVDISKVLGCEVVKKYDGIADYSILKDMISSDQEGVVIRFSNGDRMKIKGDEYVRLHRIVTNISSLDIWETLSDKTRDITQLLDNVPDEFDKWVRDTIRDLKYSYMSIQEHAGKLMDNLYESGNGELPFKTRGEFADWVHRQDIHIRAILFRMYEGRRYDDIIWRLVRPRFEKPFKKETDENC